MTIQFLLASFSAIIILNSIFFGFVLLFNSKGLLRNKLLAFLLFGIALRTGKSILMLLFPYVPDSVPAVGLVGMGAIGPLFFFYSKDLLQENWQWRPQYLMHFLFSVIMGVSLLFATDEIVFWLYFFTAVHMAIYIGVTAHSIWSKRLLAEAETMQWLKLLIPGLSVMWCVYAIQLFFQGLATYLTGTVIASLALFVLLYHAMRSHRVFGKSKRFARTDKNEQLSRQIISLMEQQKLYKDSDLTLSKLAGVLKVKPYVVSGVLNEYHGKSFPEFINYYRIQEAQQLLQSKKHQVYSIESIAFDCGFNTPSAFYTYFKKITKLTPSEYRASKTDFA